MHKLDAAPHISTTGEVDFLFRQPKPNVQPKTIRHDGYERKRKRSKTYTERAATA